MGARSTANQNSLCEVLVVTDDVQCMSCRGESRLVELCRSREEPPGQKFSLLTLICYWWVTKCELDRLLQCTGACHQTHHLTLAEDPCNKLGEHTHLQFYCAFNHTHTHTPGTMHGQSSVLLGRVHIQCSSFKIKQMRYIAACRRNT